MRLDPEQVKLLLWYTKTAPSEEASSFFKYTRDEFSKAFFFFFKTSSGTVSTNISAEMTKKVTLTGATTGRKNRNRMCAGSK